MEGKHKPTQSARYYPGAFLKPERIQQLRAWQVDIDDLTMDDRVFQLSQTVTGWLHGLLGLVVEKYGKEAAKETTYKLAHLMAGRALTTFMRAQNVEQMTPELMCRYQDTGHAMGGSAMATATSSYDDRKCEIIRTACNFFSPSASEATRDLCLEMCRGGMDAYMELSPNMECLLEEALPKGHSFCREVFRLRE